MNQVRQVACYCANAVTFLALASILSGSTLVAQTVVQEHRSEYRERQNRRFKVQVEQGENGSEQTSDFLESRSGSTVVSTPGIASGKAGFGFAADDTFTFERIAKPDTFVFQDMQQYQKWMRDIRAVNSLPSGWWPELHHRFVFSGDVAGFRGLTRVPTVIVEQGVVLPNVELKTDFELRAPRYQVYSTDPRPEAAHAYARFGPPVSFAWRAPQSKNRGEMEFNWRLMQPGEAPGIWVVGDVKGAEMSMVKGRLNQTGPANIFFGLDGESNKKARTLLFRYETVNEEYNFSSEPELDAYWLGVECAPLPYGLQSHLDLEAGLYVQSVAPASPAKRIGLQAHDIIVSYDEEPLRSPEQLGELVQAHKDQPVHLDVRRKGNQISIVVQAEPRIQQVVGKPVYTFGAVLNDQHDSEPMRQTISRWSKSLAQTDSDRGTLRIVLVRPGIVVDSDKVELQTRIVLDDSRELQLIKKTGANLGAVIRNQNENVEVTAEILSTMPTEFQTVVNSAMGQFLWLEEPMTVDGKPLELFPEQSLQFPLKANIDLGQYWSGNLTSDNTFKIRVDPRGTPVTNQPEPFQVRNIEIRAIGHNGALRKLERDEKSAEFEEDVERKLERLRSQGQRFRERFSQDNLPKTIRESGEVREALKALEEEMKQLEEEIRALRDAQRELSEKAHKNRD